jgi:hypothetical protein
MGSDGGAKGFTCNLELRDRAKKSMKVPVAQQSKVVCSSHVDIDR